MARCHMIKNDELPLLAVNSRNTDNVPLDTYFLLLFLFIELPLSHQFPLMLLCGYKYIYLTELPKQTNIVDLGETQ